VYGYAAEDPPERSVAGYIEHNLETFYHSQFTCYRLGRLTDEQVGEFSRMWFAQDREIGPGEAETWTEAFVAESAPASDLRTNPLMLSLLCILYRCAGSLPAIVPRCTSNARC
jgi:hypothetical protein